MKKCIALQKQNLKTHPTKNTTKCKGGSCNLMEDKNAENNIKKSFQETKSYLS